jgi:hypothetical protein
MGSCLEVDCEPLVWSEQQWKQLTARPSTIQVNATARLGAFSLQASPLGLLLLSFDLAP